MSGANIEIKDTLDGSCTLFDPGLNETYHSLHGALSESLHVYIHNGIELQGIAEKPKVRILEIGFGTGLNLLLTLQHRLPQMEIEYLTIEPFPLDMELIDAYYANFKTSMPGLDKLKKLYSVNSDIWIEVENGFRFQLKKAKIQEAEFEMDWKADLVYFDAFAPSRQPEMWHYDVLAKVAGLMAGNSAITTYCAQGQFKRNLRLLGLNVENPKGANGKREMTVARKP